MQPLVFLFGVLSWHKPSLCHFFKFWNGDGKPGRLRSHIQQDCTTAAATAEFLLSQTTLPSLGLAFLPFHGEINFEGIMWLR
jgi:hypothetical protein